MIHPYNLDDDAVRATPGGKVAGQLTLQRIADPLRVLGQVPVDELVNGSHDPRWVPDFAQGGNAVWLVISHGIWASADMDVLSVAGVFVVAYAGFLIGHHLGIIEKSVNRPDNQTPTECFLR